jgi:two-component system, cell cycle sensor histidine kinase and response regulator CckA
MTFTEKRSTIRISHQSNLTCSLLDADQYHDATTINHSRGGLLLETDTAYCAGDWLHLCMEHYEPGSLGPEAYRSYTAEVVSCQPITSNENPHYGVGVTFLDKMQSAFVGLKQAPDTARSSMTLRRKAEQYLLEHPETQMTAPGADVRNWVHELQVHQIELEIQNEELRQAQQTISNAMTKYADLYDFAPVGYFTFDGSGIIKEANLKGSNLLQTERRFLLGMPFVRFVAPEDRPIFIQHFRAAMKSVSIQKAELRLNLKNGTQAHVRLESIKSPGPKETASKVSTAVIDITERKRVEDERQILAERLAQVEKLEAIGTLAGGVAHDFNNALMGIQGSVSLLQLDLEPNRSHMAHLNRIEQMVDRSADLTKQLLGFARGGKYRAYPIDLNPLILNTLELFARTRKDLHTKAFLQNEPSLVKADRSQMEQVLFNLFLNAHNAMPKGGSLSITTNTVALSKAQVQPNDLAAGRYIRIKVMDTGIGMDAKTQRRIFEPFFSTKDMAQSTGMGLASVHGIVTNHKGIIEVISQVGKGTSFIIHLPVSDAQAQAAVKPDPDALHRGTQTLLLVDDEPQIRQVVSQMLEYLGYTVKLAVSGKEALEIYDPAMVDLVLLDMTMPDMDGGQTFDRLRQLNPAIKVVLASGFSRQGRAEEIVKRGCKAFIKKPYSLHNLSDTLRDIFDDRNNTDD